VVLQVVQDLVALQEAQEHLVQVVVLALQDLVDHQDKKVEYLITLLVRLLMLILVME
jgi:hypothetical protein